MAETETQKAERARKEKEDAQTRIAQIQGELGELGKGELGKFFAAIIYLFESALGGLFGWNGGNFTQSGVVKEVLNSIGIPEDIGKALIDQSGAIYDIVRAHNPSLTPASMLLDSNETRIRKLTDAVLKPKVLQDMLKNPAIGEAFLKMIPDEHAGLRDRLIAKYREKPTEFVSHIDFPALANGLRELGAKTSDQRKSYLSDLVKKTVVEPVSRNMDVQIMTPQEISVLVSNPTQLSNFLQQQLGDSISPANKAALATWLQQPTTNGKTNLHAYVELMTNLDKAGLTQADKSRVQTLLQSISAAIGAGNQQGITQAVTGLINDPLMKNDKALDALRDSLKQFSFPEPDFKKIIADAANNHGIPAWLAPYAARLKGIDEASLRDIYQQTIRTATDVLTTGRNLHVIRDTVGGVKKENVSAISEIINGAMTGKVDFNKVIALAGSELSALEKLTQLDVGGLAGTQKQVAESTKDNLNKLIKFAKGLSETDRTAFFNAFVPETGKEPDLNTLGEKLDPIARKYASLWRETIGSLNLSPFIGATADRDVKARIRAFGDFIKDITDSLPQQKTEARSPITAASFNIPEPLLRATNIVYNPNTGAPDGHLIAASDKFIEEQQRKQSLQA